MILCPLHQGLCSFCSIALGYLHDYFLCMYYRTTYCYAVDRLLVKPLSNCIALYLCSWDIGMGTFSWDLFSMRVYL